MRGQRRCAACGAMGNLTKHHVYPKSLHDVWRYKVKQVILPLCRLCHDVVHLKTRLSAIRWAAKQDPANREYLWRWASPEIQQTLGPLRRIIRELERESRAIHLDWP